MIPSPIYLMNLEIIITMLWLSKLSTCQHLQETLQVLTGLKPSNQVPIASNSQVTLQLLARLSSSNQVLLASNSQEIYQENFGL